MTPQTVAEWHEHYQAIRSRLLKAGIAKPAVIAVEKKASPPPVHIAFKVFPPPSPETIDPYKALYRRWEIPAMPERMRKICADVCREAKIPFPEIASASRKAYLMPARQQLMHALYVGCPGISLPTIGRLMGGKDHTTILHGIRRHAARLAAEVA